MSEPAASPPGGAPSSRLKRAARSLSPTDLLRSPYGVTPLVIFLLFNIIGGFGGDLVTVAGPSIAADVGLDLGVVVGVISIVGTAGLVVQLGLSWLADRTRRSLMFSAGCAAQGIATMGTAGITSTGGYVATNVAGQLGSDATFTPSYSLMADYYPTSSRGRLVGVLFSIGEFSGVISAVIAGLTVTAFGWRANYLVVGTAILVIGLVSAVVLREPRRGYFERLDMGLSAEAAALEDEPKSFAEGWRAFFAVRTLRRIWLGSMCSYVALIPLLGLFPYLLAQVYHLDALHRSLANLPIVLMVVVGGYLGGAVVDILGRIAPGSVLRIVGASGVIGVAGIGVLANTPPLWLAVVGYAMHQLVSAVSAPASFTVTSQVIPAAIRTQALQMFQITSIPASILLGLVFGRILTSYGFGPMFAATLPFSVAAAVLYYSAGDYYETDRRNAMIANTAAEEARRAQAEGRQKLLVCRQVDVAYDSNQVLFGVDLVIEEGEIVALLGTNGAGKSTLLRAISGIQEAGNGAIVLDGRDITHMPPHEIAKRGVVHMPGGRGMFSGMTVEENLLLATWMAESEDVGALLQRAYDLFPILRTRRTQLASALSGGEQQMLSLAQAFLAKPRLLLIDELSLGLSPAVVGELLEKVRAIHAQGTTVVVVEQSVNVALSIAGRAVFMEKGEVRFAGPTAELLARPDILRSVYVRGTGGGGNGSSAHDAVAIRRAAEVAAARPILEVAGVGKRFGGITALEGVNLTLRDGEILGLLGPNGSGKTTLFDIISGYQPADQGSIRLEGRDITSLSAHERARLGVVRRFQDARLFPSLTVQETLLVALDRRLEVRNLAGEALALPMMRRSERRARRQADGLIELLSLEAHRDKFVRELSTGLRRILDLAVVLAAEPRVLLLDEPSAGIAQTEAESLGPLLTRVRRETGCSVLIIEHDIPLITAVADDLVAMVTGQVIVRGPAADVLGDERVIAAYLGSSDAAIRRSGSIA